MRPSASSEPPDSARLILACASASHMVTGAVSDMSDPLPAMPERPHAVIYHLPVELGFQIDAKQVAVVEEADKDVGQLTADALGFCAPVATWVDGRPGGPVLKSPEAPRLDRFGGLGD